MFNMFIGYGYDEHLLEKGTEVVLGGHKFNSEYKIKAHSDGDVVLHALTDAILGSLGMDDIGTYFPDNKEENKNRSSVDFLNFAIDKMNDKKFSNIDITIQCSNIMLKDQKELIKKSLTKLTKCDIISVKATRFEEGSNLINCRASILIK